MLACWLQDIFFPSKKQTSRYCYVDEKWLIPNASLSQLTNNVWLGLITIWSQKSTELLSMSGY